MKQLSITLVLLLSWFGAAAQHDLYKWQLKGYTGVANFYNTDKNTEDYFKAYDNLLYSLELNRSLGNTFGLAASASYGNVRGIGQAGRPFTTEARMAAVRLYFYTDNGWLLNTSAVVSPFFFGGYGLGTLKTDYNSENYETNEIQLVPFGLGLKFRLGERWQLDLHTEAVYNTKDLPIPAAAEQNEYNNTFLHTGFSLAYSFGFKKSSFKAPVFYAGFLGPPASPRTVKAAPARSMLDFILELEPKAVQLESAASKDSLVQAPKKVAPVAVSEVPVTSDRLVESDTLSSIKIDSVQLSQDSTALRKKVAPVQIDSVQADSGQAVDSVQTDSLRQTATRQNMANRASTDSAAAATRAQSMAQDSVQADSVRRATASERVARRADANRTYTSDEEQSIVRDTVQLDTGEALTDTLSGVRRQQMRLRAREQELREREQRVRDREQDARERELDARERELKETGSNDQERRSETATSRLTPAEQRERAQEPTRRTTDTRTVYVPAEPSDRTVRIKTSPIGQIDPATLLLLGRDQKKLDDINRNNRELRNRLDSLQAATAGANSQQLQDTSANKVDAELLTYMQQQAALNDSMMQRLGYYEGELQRLRATAAAPEEATVASNTSVFFGLNSHTVPAASYDELLAVARLLQENPDLRLKLTGYTDQTGDPKYNLALSRKRAAAVARFFEAQGVPETRITTANAGEDKSGGKVNPASRRVTLEIVK